VKVVATDHVVEAAERNKPAGETYNNKVIDLPTGKQVIIA